MDLIRAQNTFAERLYEWSVRDFVRELSAGCPLLSSVGLNNYTVAAFVKWVETMSPQQREILARALPRRAHENAAALLGVSLTPQDLDYWNKEFFTRTATLEHSLPPFVSGDECSPLFEPVDPDECLDTLLISLTPVLGKASRRKSGVRATQLFGDWKLTTEFTFSRTDRDLRFEYQFVRKDGKPVIGHDSPFPRNLFWFYGVINTSVDVPSRSDAVPMARVMARLAEYFVAQADPLFDGLGVND